MALAAVLSQVQILKDKLNEGLYSEGPWKYYIELLEAKTGLERTKLAYFAAAFIGVYLVFGYGGQLVCNLIGFTYPAYCSMKALETQTKEDDTKWLTYWVVFAWFSIVEYFADFIVGWVPIYWLIKCVFLVWCFLPIQYNGSNVIYNSYIRPHFLRNQGHVDSLLNDLKKKAMNKFSRVKIPEIKDD